jgi:hypothetical protein
MPKALDSDNGSLRRLYRKYKISAKRRELTFDLSLDQFKSLTSAICSYCGCIPANIAELSPGSKNTYPYIYNGIDRVDNSIGYEYQNCVTCCSICNYMKGTLGHIQFIMKVNQIVLYQAKG